MKILIIGAGGTIGKQVAVALKEHEVITVGRNTGTIKADISEDDAVERLFKQVPDIDAVICVAGDSNTDNLSAITKAQFMVGIEQKLWPQINLVLSGMKYLNDNGSFTLISGKMGDLPIRGSSGKAFVNGAINSFVKAAAQEMPRGIRLNAISPGKVLDIDSNALVAAYLICLETDINGEIVNVGYQKN
ncbi:NAD(P)-dependent dehydrogenase, short-chain alcohol dehydrogenase family [Chitinophaga jiangningensis]|uniref:NAD(P)-dependent dehydrogenase, short-chain alcohol dehydrogenase family n=1 Tax=Chitinophaga jiangningensis TaxID=1419482 RepID=A0A1M7JEK0_9BACT|nr:short chain dehydrogenase [Chitinophaga jiangningensis]SHM50947.1 NAD(P)-dependent dehydrogenase, short-chain alcohol dehydrogenase family [Chitinophaga jiangningensis]